MVVATILPWRAGLVILVIVLLVGLVAADPMQCKQDFGKLWLEHRAELALMADATGKAVDDLGKWDECRDLGADVSHYCTIRFFLNISIPTPYLGLCLPSSCSASDIGLTNDQEAEFELIYQAVVKMQEKAGLYEYQCAQDTPSPFSSAGGVVVILFTLGIAILVVMGTVMDGYDADWWPEEEASVSVPSILGGIQDEAEVKPLLHKSNQRRSKLFDFFVAFSIARNFKSLVGPSPPALAFLNGMRAISITWVILGHSLDYMNYTGIVNFAHVVTKDVQHASAQVFPGAEFSVDSFFWLSGFLVTYLTVQELKNKKRVNWFLYYFHRVENTCGKYWWANLLYINNFVPSMFENQCFLWGWYLAVDMQLCWILVAVLLIGTVVINGVLAHTHHFEWNATDPHVYMSMVYGKPYTRAAPWLLGIACAFLYLERVQLTRLVVYIGWTVSAITMMLCVYGPANQFKGGSSELEPPVNTWIGNKSFLYFTFSKVGWSLALSFLMYSMAMGWGGFVRRFLGASMWNPLARLTYSTYLFHPIIIYFSYDHFYIAIIFVGITFLSFCTAAVMFLALERPMVNMEKLFLHKKH